MITCNCCQLSFETNEEYTAHFQTSKTTLPILQLVREFYLVPKAKFTLAKVQNNIGLDGRLDVTYLSFVKRG